MAITVPETEPLDFYSGETVKWKRTDLSNYPAPTWTLNYFLQKTGTKIDFAHQVIGIFFNDFCHIPYDSIRLGFGITVVIT